jgi:RNA polymerase sigma-70 factor (ECF subfamily)
MVAPLERPEAPLCGRTADLCRLFEAEGAYVWNSLRRLGVPPSDLEDLTHDLFLEVQRRLDDYDPGRPVRPWLFGFALRLALRHRKRAHRRYEQPSTGQENVADASALPDQQLAARQDRRLVLSALEGIDMSRRAVFVLHDIDGESMPEIARALGLPVNTAYSRLRAARADFAAAVRRLRPEEGRR